MANPINPKQLEADYQVSTHEPFSGLDANIFGTVDAHLPAQANTFAKHIFGAITPPTTVFSGEDPHIKFGIKIRDGKIKLPSEKQEMPVKVSGLSMAIKNQPAVQSSILGFVIANNRDNFGFKVKIGTFELFQPLIHTSEVQALDPNGVNYIPDELPVATAIEGIKYFIKNPPKEPDFQSRKDLPQLVHRILADLRINVKARITQPLFKLMDGAALALRNNGTENYGFFYSSTRFINPLGHLDKRAQALKDNPAFEKNTILETLTKNYSEVIITLDGLDTPLAYRVPDFIKLLGDKQEKALNFIHDYGSLLQNKDVYCPQVISFISPEGKSIDSIDVRFIHKSDGTESSPPLSVVNKTGFRFSLDGIRSRSGLWAIIPADIKLGIKSSTKLNIESLLSSLTLDEMGFFAPLKALTSGITLSHGVSLRAEKLFIPDGFEFAGIKTPEISAKITEQSGIEFNKFRIKYNPEDKLSFSGSLNGSLHVENLNVNGTPVADQIDVNLKCSTGTSETLISCEANGTITLHGKTQTSGLFGIDVVKNKGEIGVRLRDATFQIPGINLNGLKIDSPTIKLHDGLIQPKEE